jgi:hypothetical protein
MSASVTKLVPLPKPRPKAPGGASAWSHWSWGGVAFLVFGLAAAFVIPRPLGYLLAILGLVVCIATVAGGIMSARYVKDRNRRSIQEPSRALMDQTYGDLVEENRALDREVREGARNP